VPVDYPLQVDAAVEETVVVVTVVDYAMPVEETVVEESAVDYAMLVDAALEDVAPEDAPVFVPDAKAEDSWKRMLWNV
jgi:hypothetical protein